MTEGGTELRIEETMPFEGQPTLLFVGTEASVTLILVSIYDPRIQSFKFNKNKLVSERESSERIFVFLLL